MQRSGWRAGWVLAGVALVASQGAGSATAAEADLRTAVLVAGCQGCHGNAGAGAGGIPSIAGTMSHADFVAAMKAFQGNARPASVMNRIARGYTEEELALLATRYAKPQ